MYRLIIAWCACVLAAAALAGISPQVVRAAVPSAKQRVLWLRRAGYSEDIVAPFSLDGRTVYVPGYRMICWAMRDRAVAPAVITRSSCRAAR